MKYEFKPPRLRDDFEDERFMKKKYGKAISIGMIAFLGALDSAENAYDTKCIPLFFMEHKKGNLREFYSISLDKKKSKWRLLVQMLDGFDNVICPDNDEKKFLKSVKKMRIGELSEHYE